MEKKNLTLLSYNIHKGFSSSNRTFVLKKMRDSIREVHADLVFLQEVLGHHKTHGKHIDEASQFEYLAETIWPHYAYGKNAVYDQGHHGNAILSKFPIRSFENIDISANRMAKRGMLHAVIDLPHGGILHAISLHMGLFESERKSQIESLCRRIESHVPHHEPLVIGGDFNDWLVRATPTLARKLGVEEAFLSLSGAHARTYPSWLPALSLDRIYFRGMTPQSARCLTQKPWSQLSDHAALVVDFAGIHPVKSH